MNFVYGDRFRLLISSSHNEGLKNVLPSVLLQAEQLMFGYSCSQENERASRNGSLGECQSVCPVPGQAKEEGYSCDQESEVTSLSESPGDSRLHLQQPTTRW